MTKLESLKKSSHFEVVLKHRVINNDLFTIYRTKNFVKKTKENKSYIKTGRIKANPPPLGIGFLCKLLLFGLSKKYFLRNLMKLLKSNYEKESPTRKYIKNKFIYIYFL